MGESNIFKKITPNGAGPTQELKFEGGIIKKNDKFTDNKIPSEANSITEHFAYVSYSVDSKATGQSTAGKSGDTMTFNATNGSLSLTPFQLTSAYVTSLLDVLDTTRIDPSFANDPILGATVSVTPFQFEYSYSEDGADKFYFSDAGGMLTIAMGTNTFLTASLDAGMVYDPDQRLPFFAPLDDITLNTTLGSEFIDEIQARLVNPNELSFDFFIGPDANFAEATNGFQISAAASVNAGVAQNGHSVPEPSSFLLLIGGLISTGAVVARRRSMRSPVA